jgi:hypothetical protein
MRSITSIHTCAKLLLSFDRRPFSTTGERHFIAAIAQYPSSPHPLSSELQIQNLPNRHVNGSEFDRGDEKQENFEENLSFDSKVMSYQTSLLMQYPFDYFYWLEKKHSKFAKYII